MVDGTRSGSTASPAMYGAVLVTSRIQLSRILLGLAWDQDNR